MAFYFYSEGGKLVKRAQDQAGWFPWKKNGNSHLNSLIIQSKSRNMDTGHTDVKATYYHSERSQAPFVGLVGRRPGRRCPL